MDAEKKSYKLGVALSGGGARGFAHAGALKAIEEAGLKPDIVAGVSAGSVIATFYAAGIAPDDMPKVFADIGFSKLADFKIGGGGLFSLDKFRKMVLKAISPAKNFEDLKMPLYIGATDMDNARSVYFSSGSLGDKIEASCSIPIVFQPVKIDGVHYVDGGVLRNLPANAIRDKCECLIGVNVSPMTPFRKPNSVLEVALRTYNIMAKHNVEDDLTMCDLAIETRDISSYKVFNLKEIQKVFNSGYINARKALRSAGWWNPNP